MLTELALAAPTVAGRSRGAHEAWRHTESAAKPFMPRHREIGVGVVPAICRQLGVPPIRNR